MACTSSGRVRSSMARKRPALREMVSGPSHCRRAVRSCRLEAPHSPARGLDPGPGEDFTPEKATGTNSSTLNFKPGWQAKVDASDTSSPRSIKYRIQFKAVGERPSATNKMRIGSIYHNEFAPGAPGHILKFWKAFVIRQMQTTRYSEVLFEA